MAQEIVKSDEKYQALIEDCRTILGEGVWTARMELIIAYGRLGRRILEDPLYQKYQRGNQEFLRELASDSGISYATLLRAVQFYKKYEIDSPESEGWKLLPEGKNISWHKIVKNYLPTGASKKHICDWRAVEMCRICRKIRPVENSA
jgi:hypothetical protein